MIIREATTEDIEELNSFYIRMNEIINTRTNNYNPDNPVFPSREMIEEAVVSQGLFIGEEDSRIVIACIVNHSCAREYSMAKWNRVLEAEDFWVLHALRVLPEYERRGYARQMLQHLGIAARERHLKAIRLDVLEGYSVEKLYLSSGYKYVDTIEILYEDIGSLQRFRLFENIIQ